MPCVLYPTNSIVLLGGKEEIKCAPRKKLRCCVSLRIDRATSVSTRRPRVGRR